MNEKSTFYMPEAASNVAQEVDRLYYFIHWVSVFFFILVVALMTYFVIRYRRRSDTETTPDYSHNTVLEVLWSVIPLLILIVIFFWGFGTYMDIRVSPGNSYNVYVTAQRWSWQFQYPNGISSSGELVVPVNQPIKLTMSSRDLIHGFYVPDFRIKQDVLPNRYTSLWFQANAVGTHDLYCTQYCGTGHSTMRGTVRVVSADEFSKWVQTGGIDVSKLTLPQFGAALYRVKGCISCHSVDGSPRIGPSFKGIFNQPVKLTDGTSVTADENYIRESLMVPGAKIVAGYPNIMPSFQGQLKDKETNALIEYIKSLK